MTDQELLRVLSVTANKAVTGGLWRAATKPADGYTWTLCGWLVIAYRLGWHRKGRIDCPTCRAKLEEDKP